MGYYGGRSADAYLRGRRRSLAPLLWGLLGLLVLGGVFAAGVVVGRATGGDDAVEAAGAAVTTTVASTLPATSTLPTLPPLPTTSAVVGARPETYIVQKGDSLDAIAKRFGTSIAALVELNGITNPDRLIEGTTLKIPPTTVATPAP
jgi:LysM repeat protein